MPTNFVVTLNDDRVVSLPADGIYVFENGDLHVLKDKKAVGAFKSAVWKYVVRQDRFVARNALGEDLVSVPLDDDATIKFKLNPEANLYQDRQ